MDSLSGEITIVEVTVQLVDFLRQDQKLQQNGLLEFGAGLMYVAFPESLFTHNGMDDESIPAHEKNTAMFFCSVESSTKEVVTRESRGFTILSRTYLQLRKQHIVHYVKFSEPRVQKHLC